MMREFRLELPGAGSGDGRQLDIRLPKSFNVPRRLERTGLAGYEPHTLATCLAVLDVAHDGEFFDVGANVGVFSWLVSAVTQRSVVAFEPVPWLLDGARSVAADNELSIACEPLALSASTGQAEFYVSAKSDCSNSLRQGFRQSSETLKVELDTLTHYVEKTGRRPALIKIDTESTEPDVLRGGLRFIEECRPWIICEVLAGRTESALMEIMGGLDYSWYQITDATQWDSATQIAGDRTYRFVNWLFAPRDLDENFWRHLRRRREQLRHCTTQPGRARLYIGSNELEAFGNDEAGPWRCTAVAPSKVTKSGEGVAIRAELDGGERFFLFNGRDEPGFDTAPASVGAWPIVPGRSYELRVTLRRQAQRMPMQLWVLEYDADEQVAKHEIRMGNGENRLSFTANSRARVARVVFRVSGHGEATLSDLTTLEVTDTG